MGTGSYDEIECGEQVTIPYVGLNLEFCVAVFTVSCPDSDNDDSDNIIIIERKWWYEGSQCESSDPELFQQMLLKGVDFGLFFEWDLFPTRPKKPKSSPKSYLEDFMSDIPECKGFNYYDVFYGNLRGSGGVGVVKEVSNVTGVFRGLPKGPDVVHLDKMPRQMGPTEVTALGARRALELQKASGIHRNQLLTTGPEDKDPISDQAKLYKCLMEISRQVGR